MKNRFLIALFILCSLALVAAAADAPPILGNWEGSLDTPAGEYPIILHVTQGKDGKLTGTMDSPEQGVKGLAITTMTFNGTDFHFEIKPVNGIYDGKVKDDHSAITGEWDGPMGKMPLNLKRPTKQ